MHRIYIICVTNAVLFAIDRYNVQSNFLSSVPTTFHDFHK